MAKTINVTPGGPSQVRVTGNDTGMTVTAGKFDPLMPPLYLTVTQNGQTRWNLGEFEVRQHVYVNGLLQKPGVDYQINLPYLDYLGPALETDDELTLTL